MSLTASGECFNAAVEYLKMGWSAIALCPPNHEYCSKDHKLSCKKPGKVPLRKWEKWQKELPTIEDLENQWRLVPKANVGVVMGSISGLIGIDVDGAGGDDWLTELSCGDIPPTVAFNTGRDDSYRLIYALPKGHPCPTVCFANPDGSEPLKFLGEGGQTVMPPSKHASGHRYHWINKRSPKDIKVAEAPPWLLGILKNKQNEGGKGKESQSKNKNQPKEQLPGVSEGVVEGGRNAYLTRVAGAMRRQGCSQEEIYECLRFINSNRCKPPLAPAEVSTIAKSMSKYEPREVPSEKALDKGTQQKAGAVLHSFDSIVEEKLQWTWRQWMPEGCLVCVDGDGGTGKSTMLIEIAARLSRGDVLPDGTRPTSWKGPAKCLMVACEDSASAVIKPRVIAARGNEQNIFYLEEVLDQGSKETRQISLDRDCDVIEEIVAQNKIKFVFIDPITAFLGSADYSSDQEVRSVMGPLKRIAERHKCTIAYVRHWNKGSVGQKATYRGGGSLVFTNLARIGITVGHHPEDENRSVMAVSKGNYSKERKGLVFEVVEVPGKEGIGKIVWHGKTELTADQMVEVRDQAEVEKSKEAIEWLADLLANGKSKESKEILRLGVKQGYSEKTIYRAKVRLGIKSKKEVYCGKAVWKWEIKKEEERPGKGTEEADMEHVHEPEESSEENGPLA